MKELRLDFIRKKSPDSQNETKSNLESYLDDHQPDDIYLSVYDNNVQSAQNETESILSLVNQLIFKIDEKEEPEFFTKLETILEDESIDSDEHDPMQYKELMRFFVRYASVYEDEMGA